MIKMFNEIFYFLSVGCLSLAFIFSLLACWQSKEVLIKLVSLEVLVNLFICGVGVCALHIDFSLLLDICIALSLTMFLSTVAYCQFLMKRAVKND